MGKRRGHGEGSLFRDGRGRWVATVEAGWTEDGTRRRLRAVRRTKAEAVIALDELRRRAGHGPLVAADVTVAAYLDWWLTTVKRGLADSSRRAYVTRITWACRHIGTVKLSRLTADHVEAMMAELERQGLGAWSRSKTRSVLVSALRYAERTGRVGRNVAALVDGPGTEHVIDALSADEARAVLAAASEHPYGLAAVLGLRLGLRIGEIAALRWDDVTDETLTVTASKTAAGRRTLPLAGAEAALRERRRHQAAERLAAGPLWASDGSHVFTGPLGAPISTRTLRRHWGAWCEEAGIGPRRFHASRHTAATLLLADGVPLEVVSAVLGHASLAITSDVYARVSADAKRAALGRLGDVLG